MNYLKLLQNLKKDLLQSNYNFETIKFFRKDIPSTWLWFSTLESYYSGKDTNIETIMSTFQSGYISRPTFFKIINNAVAKKYLIKNKDKND